MKILVVGQGGREHVLAWKLAQSPLVTEVLCAPGNAGTEIDARNVDVAADDVERLVKLAQAENVDLTIVGPEAPLVAGIADAFDQAGLKVFGPSQAAAELEGSKVFAKQMMRQANVPTADFADFQSADAAIAHIDDRSEQGLVVKADGLAAGKGVSVCATKEEARVAVRQMMVENVFGDAGSRIVIEERLEGEEASILALVDGNTIVPLAASQDHKAALDGDRGPNTGGMGAYCPAPIIDDAALDEIVAKILIPMVHTMKRSGRPFRGVLYAGLMMTPQGPKVLEFNVRFGDPEAQPVLMRLKTDLARLLLAATEGRLHEFPALEWDLRPAVCVVMASEGYPGKYETGRPIRGLSEAGRLPDVKVFHAGTIRHGNEVVTNGGRVLGVTALGRNISDAKLRAYQAVKLIRWNGAWCRKDISDKARRFDEGPS
ncbi:MAG: phosphoribosylamine--glycine ligase [Planctomycetaceae bacterium]